MFSAVVVPLKKLFQESCWSKLIGMLLFQMRLITSGNLSLMILRVSEIELPRSLLSNTQRDKIRRVELHGFSDAGKVAYGAKVYIRIETDDGFSSSLVASKSRLTPLKEETVPHLELLGALLLAELITSVRNALKSLIKVDWINCWSDSQIFL